MQVRKIKERKAEKRTISSSSSSAGSRSPERNSEGDGAKKQVGTKEGFGRRRAGEFMSVSSVLKQRIVDEAKGVFSRLSTESAERALALVKTIEVKFIPGDMLAWGHIIKLRFWAIFPTQTPCILAALSSLAIEHVSQI